MILQFLLGPYIKSSEDEMGFGMKNALPCSSSSHPWRLQQLRQPFQETLTSRLRTSPTLLSLLTHVSDSPPQSLVNSPSNLSRLSPSLPPLPPPPLVGPPLLPPAPPHFTASATSSTTTLIRTKSSPLSTSPSSHLTPTSTKSSALTPSSAFPRPMKPASLKPAS